MSVGNQRLGYWAAQEQYSMEQLIGFGLRIAHGRPEPILLLNVVTVPVQEYYDKELDHRDCDSYQRLIGVQGF